MNLNDLKWDVKGNFWYSGDCYNISPKDLLNYAKKLETVVEAGRITNDVLNRICESFPDNEIPHPSIKECLDAYCDLNNALNDLDEELS